MAHLRKHLVLYDRMLGSPRGAFVLELHPHLDRKMVCRVWAGLLLAAFFNLQSSLYYELFSNFMGKGDKESFAHALRAARLHYHLLEVPVGSVGITK